MNEVMTEIHALFSGDETRKFGQAALVLILGMAIALIIPRRIRRFNLQPQQSLILRAAIRYGTWIVTIAWTLNLLGLNLSVLFGAAGILTVALGFASQASASNLISGLFLMFESHFVVGDLITVGDITGEVTSIDPLSVKVRTFQNLSVRIPNETMLKSNVVNLYAYPIRRYDLLLTIDYGADLAVVSETLLGVAARLKICLVDPKPFLVYLGYEERGLALQFSTWSTRENYVELRNTVHIRVKEAFDENNLVIPVLRRALHVTQTSPPTT